MSHKYEEGTGWAAREKSDAAPAASGPTCAVCGCLKDDAEHKVTLTKRLKLKK